MSRMESDEDDDKEAEHEEKVKALQILGHALRISLRMRVRKAMILRTAIRPVRVKAKMKATRGTGKEAEMQALVAVSQEAETTGKKGLANSTTNKADWTSSPGFSRQCPDKKKSWWSWRRTS